MYVPFGAQPPEPDLRFQPNLCAPAALETLLTSVRENPEGLVTFTVTCALALSLKCTVTRFGAAWRETYAGVALTPVTENAPDATRGSASVTTSTTASERRRPESAVPRAVPTGTDIVPTPMSLRARMCCASRHCDTRTAVHGEPTHVWLCD